MLTACCFQGFLASILRRLATNSMTSSSILGMPLLQANGLARARPG